MSDSRIDERSNKIQDLGCVRISQAHAPTFWSKLTFYLKLQQISDCPNPNVLATHSIDARTPKTD
jgi:hypothetical protein